MGGVPWLPFSWRWGFGQDFPDGYYDRKGTYVVLEHVEKKLKKQ